MEREPATSWRNLALCRISRDKKLGNVSGFAVWCATSACYLEVGPSEGKGFWATPRLLWYRRRTPLGRGLLPRRRRRVNRKWIPHPPCPRRTRHYHISAPHRVEMTSAGSRMAGSVPRGNGLHRHFLSSPVTPSAWESGIARFNDAVPKY